MNDWLTAPHVMKSVYNFQVSFKGFIMDQFLLRYWKYFDLSGFSTA